MREIKTEIPPFDILIDDGGHTMRQQIVTFEELFDHVKENGVYLCEDMHSSYGIKSGGGYKRRGTFVEFSKNLIDYINAYHSRQKILKVNEYTKSIHSLHFYDSVLVIEKTKMSKPYRETSGTPCLPNDEPLTQSNFKRIKKIVRLYCIGGINIILRFLRLPGFIWK